MGRVRVPNIVHTANFVQPMSSDAAASASASAASVNADADAPLLIPWSRTISLLTDQENAPPHHHTVIMHTTRYYIFLHLHY
ncbi:hypothetical protein PP707_04695, partial [Acetobacter pasteurianus]|nr:hypothetical protein [Acetobacter pasteurianus]